MLSGTCSVYKGLSRCLSTHPTLESNYLLPPPFPASQVGYEEKLDSLQLEYTYLLTSQLESQRVYFEEKLTRVETAANEQARHCTAHHTVLTAMLWHCSQLSSCVHQTVILTWLVFLHFLQLCALYIRKYMHDCDNL